MTNAKLMFKIMIVFAFALFFGFADVTLAPRVFSPTATSLTINYLNS